MRASAPSPRIFVKATIAIHEYRARYPNGVLAVASTLLRIKRLFMPQSSPRMLSHMARSPDGTGAICEIHGWTDIPKGSECKASRRVNPVLQGTIVGAGPNPSPTPDASRVPEVPSERVRASRHRWDQPGREVEEHKLHECRPPCRRMLCGISSSLGNHVGPT